MGHLVAEYHPPIRRILASVIGRFPTACDVAAAPRAFLRAFGHTIRIATH